MTVQEMKEFMEEQRKRFAAAGSDDDYDDDYFDNDAEMDYGDDPNDDEEAIQSSPTAATQSISRGQQIISSPSHQIQVQNLLLKKDNSFWSPRNAIPLQNFYLI